MININIFSCLVCEAYELVIINEFSSLPRVTSDSKYWPSGGILCCCESCGAVQKVQTKEWLEETKEIYSTYDLWPISQGIEQAIFSNDGKSKVRSNLIIDFLLGYLNSNSQGKILDVGCGNGAALLNFSHSLPKYDLYAADLTDRFLKELIKIPNFKNLFIGPLENIKDKFELITNIHALEHFPNPYDALISFRKLLNHNGNILIVVPNSEVSPFDYLVVDHIIHFSFQHLAHLVKRAGLISNQLKVNFLPKEILIICKISNEIDKQISHQFNSKNSIKQVRSGVQWLNELLHTAKESQIKAKQNGKRFGIFGTSIAGMWLFGAMKNLIDFFVDEDINRQGSFIEGLPILAVKDVEDGAYVFLNLVPGVAFNVQKRLQKLKVHWILPPTIK